jgi:hypothetical protein
VESVKAEGSLEIGFERVRRIERGGVVSLRLEQLDMILDLLTSWVEGGFGGVGVAEILLSIILLDKARGETKTLERAGPVSTSLPVLDALRALALSLPPTSGNRRHHEQQE